MIPSLVCSVVLLWWWIAKHREKQLTLQVLYLLTPLSLFTAVYGWVFDFVLLIPLALALAVRSASDSRAYIASVILSAACIVMAVLPERYTQDDFWWYAALHVIASLTVFLAVPRQEHHES
jgi:predicted membrane protein